MKWRQNMLVVVLSLAGFVTTFGAYAVAANLPSYSKETGAGLIVIGILVCFSFLKGVARTSELVRAASVHPVSSNRLHPRSFYPW